MYSALEPFRFAPISLAYLTKENPQVGGNGLGAVTGLRRSGVYCPTGYYMI